ncbi:MAG TPA: GNAT family N-acetyltransferase [Thermoplasmata archaeon]|nr:GNAT family N-acetyltransferase [Thermoplasmata archaeon]
MKLVIRDYRSTDRNDVVRCLDEMHDAMVPLDPWRRTVRLPTHGKLFLRQILHRVRQDQGFILVAQVDGETAGVAVAWQVKFSPAQRTTEVPTRFGYLSDLSVLARWRGRGIGTRLLHETEERFRREGCDLMGLSVFFPNQKAQRLYFRNGFSRRGLILGKQLGPPRKRWPRDYRPRRRRAR